MSGDTLIVRKYSMLMPTSEPLGAESAELMAQQCRDMAVAAGGVLLPPDLEQPTFDWQPAGSDTAGWLIHVHIRVGVTPELAARIDAQFHTMLDGLSS